MSTDSSSFPTPPPIPKVDRVTGKVSTSRFDDDIEAQSGLDGWSPSEDPFEGGVQGTRFNDAEDPSDKQRRSDEFHKRENSVI